MRDTDGFDFVGRQFKRLTPTKFLVRPRRQSIRKHLDTLTRLFRNHALPVGHQIQKANAVIRGFCNHFRTDHSTKVFSWLTNWTLRTFCKWVSRRSGRMTASKAYYRLTHVNGQKFTMPTAYTPKGKMVSLLGHSRFHRLRFHRVKGTNSPLDPRLAEYWEERRTKALFRRALADARRLRMHLLKRQNYRCAITGLPLEESSEIVTHHIIPKQVGGNDDWNNPMPGTQVGGNRFDCQAQGRPNTGLTGRCAFQWSLRSSRMRREAHVRFLGGAHREVSPYPTTDFGLPEGVFPNCCEFWRRRARRGWQVLLSHCG